jgi:hypothetical protein
MPTGDRATIHRLILGLAALHNLAFGVWAAAWPRSFFALFGMDAPRYPGIWQCLGMVIGLYGIGYAYGAWRPDRARPFVAIGLAGKVLGPIGWLMAVRAGEWPVSTFIVIAFNDIVWWLPFSLVLLEGSRGTPPRASFSRSRRPRCAEPFGPGRGRCGARASGSAPRRWRGARPA